MQKIKVITEKISLQELQEMSKLFSEQLVKGVVDVAQRKLALGAGMHVDEEALLLEQGSEQKNLWGINIYPHLPKEQWIEYDSMINIRPWQNNRSLSVEDPKLREMIAEIVDSFIE